MVSTLLASCIHDIHDIIIVSMTSLLYILQDGFFQSTSDCMTCNCDPVGAVNSSCIQPDGQCYCRDNIINTRCNTPAIGFHTRPLDFFVFEAEDALYPNVSSECNNAVCYSMWLMLARGQIRYYLQLVIQQILLDKDSWNLP